MVEKHFHYTCILMKTLRSEVIRSRIGLKHPPLLSMGKQGGIYCYGDVSLPQPQLNITGISGGKGVTIEIENSGDANATPCDAGKRTGH